MGWNLVLPSIYLSFKLSYICEFDLYEGEVMRLSHSSLSSIREENGVAVTLIALKARGLAMNALDIKDKDGKGSK